MYEKVSASFRWDDLTELVRNGTSNERSGHDYDHVTRVLSNAMILAGSREGLNYDVLVASCLLHDISFDNPKEHHLNSARRAQEIMPEYGFPEETVEQTAFCIANHNRGFSQPPNPDSELTYEAKILCDADRLDSLGAVGIIRMVSFSLNQGVPYFKSVNDSVDESIYGNIKHMIELGNRMLTPEGKKLAEERLVIMKKFLDQLSSEYC